MSVDWGPTGVDELGAGRVRWPDDADLRAERLRRGQPAVRGLERLGCSGLSELRRFHEVPNWQPIWISEEIPGLEPAPAS